MVRSDDIEQQNTKNVNNDSNSNAVGQQLGRMNSHTMNMTFVEVAAATTIIPPHPEHPKSKESSPNVVNVREDIENILPLSMKLEDGQQVHRGKIRKGGFGLMLLDIARQLVKATTANRTLQLQYQEVGYWWYAPDDGSCVPRHLSCYFQPPDYDMSHPPSSTRQALQLLMKPKKAIQQKVDNLLQDTVNEPLDPTDNCAVIHVRRSDLIFNFGHRGESPLAPIYRYVPLEDYFQVLREVSSTKDNSAIQHVVVMSDDHSVIEYIEQNTIYRDIQHNTTPYVFHYLKRPRHRGMEGGGWETHFPSDSTEQETLAILALRQLVSNCSLWIGTESSLARTLQNTMDRGYPTVYELPNYLPVGNNDFANQLFHQQINARGKGFRYEPGQLRNVTQTQTLGRCRNKNSNNAPSSGDGGWKKTNGSSFSIGSTTLDEEQHPLKLFKISKDRIDQIPLPPQGATTAASSLMQSDSNVKSKVIVIVEDPMERCTLQDDLSPLSQNQKVQMKHRHILSSQTTILWKFEDEIGQHFDEIYLDTPEGWNNLTQQLRWNHNIALPREWLAKYISSEPKDSALFDSRSTNTSVGDSSIIMRWCQWILLDCCCLNIPFPPICRDPQMQIPGKPMLCHLTPHGKAIEPFDYIQPVSYRFMNRTE